MAGGWLALRASLPRLDGTLTLPGLRAEVTVARDGNGVPTVRGTDREDLARALGFLHAQDRFFQMDLLRRRSAGELAELFGPVALPLDREARRHRFRRLAGIVAGQRLDADEVRRLDAYVAGVNAGLGALGARPWEYGLLRATPRPWTREDSVLVVYTMTLDLQGGDGRDERARLAVADVYGESVLRFLRPTVLERTAALDGSSQPAPPVPGPEDFRPRPEATVSHATPAVRRAPAFGGDNDGEGTNDDDTPPVPGSNSFALAGWRVAGSNGSGAALVANDPHLALAVPNIWYRVSLKRPDRTVTGVSLPGVPDVILGSNGDVAWGFTNSQVDSSDVVLVEPDPADPTARYRVPDGDGWERFEIARENIVVAGRAVPETLEILLTRWGPLLTPLPGAVGGRTLALRWTAHDPTAVNFALSELSEARTTDEALAVAHRAGLPAQNFLVGDRAGSIAWTIIGQIPRRVGAGFDGFLPRSWADGARGWNGFLAPDEVPMVRDPPDGQLWTANNRVLGGEALARLGDGDYDDPARAAQIRDRLTTLATDRVATPADLLAVQLDDESRFLFRWRDLLLDVLTDEVVRDEPTTLGELRRLVRAWHGHAAADEAGHRLVREFRRTVLEAVMRPIYEPVWQRDPAAKLAGYGPGVEQPLWGILSAQPRPAHLLPPSAPSWNALLLAAARETANLGQKNQTSSSSSSRSLAECTWGRVNVLRMRHPLSVALPAVVGRRWLDMPAQELPGDGKMPRVQTPTFGASMRMVVAPGREAEGIFHQPGGASGHPLSPFYRAGHDDWVAGRPTPFLPGETRHRLTLRPNG